jgi:predicted NBD/HSP70 family sugar kinase
MEPFAVAVDLGGPHIRTAAIGADASIWAKHKEPTQVRQSEAAVLDRLVLAIERTIARGRAEGGEPVGVGIGTPGVIQMATGMITESSNFPIGAMCRCGRNWRRACRFRSGSRTMPTPPRWENIGSESDEASTI